MDVSATADHSFSVPASPDEAFALVSDVPDSVRHFPGLESFDAAGPGAWRWTLAKLGSGKLSLQTIYTCRYTSDAGTHGVRWVAADAAEDNARAEGTWTITAEGSGARVRLVNTLTVTVPVPRLMRRPAQALVRRENERLIKRYVDNIQITLGGGDGRVR
jgi:carbon monoxide dehydrogenase subunit G